MSNKNKWDYVIITCSSFTCINLKSLEDKQFQLTNDNKITSYQKLTPQVKLRTLLVPHSRVIHQRLKNETKISGSILDEAIDFSHEDETSFVFPYLNKQTNNINMR